MVFQGYQDKIKHNNMNRNLRLQISPFLIYEEGTLRKVIEFRDNATACSICEYINNCIDDSDVITTNSPLLAQTIKDRCKTPVKFEDFFGEYQIVPKEIKPRKKKPVLHDEYVFWFGAYKGLKCKDTPENYKEWFIKNVDPKMYKPKKKKTENLSK